ncbi:MAG TPA: adenylate/guanylate cyclase domain-containing protein [Candidatus Nitrosotalea sp.]|nr:adenylate/guanylate cyclase domain-containing protein [Candidatus Nitrosotalea sp.]
MLSSTNLNLIHAHFFFVDVVGLSDPTMSTKTQIKKIDILNRSVSECEAFKSTSKDSMLVLPSGDGMSIGFLQGPELPLKLAIELQQKLATYNKAKIPSEIIQVRIGLHSGNVFVVNDVLNNKNIWGPGIILARRVMDFGDANHILLTPTLAESLRELSDEYKLMIKPVHDFIIKHNQTMLVYSAYGKGFGNPKAPTKGAAMRSRLGEEYLKLQKTTLYPFLETILTIKDPKKMLVHHKRTYEIKNISNEPINTVLHGIASDVRKLSLDDLKVRVYDENNRDLKISSISVDTPTQKEFTTDFNTPILKDESGRYYILEYEVEEPERYFENAFLIDCSKFVMKLRYPDGNGVKKPIVYEINQETEEKKLSKKQPTLRKDYDGYVARWARKDIVKGQTFRMEW